MNAWLAGGGLAALALACVALAWRAISAANDARKARSEKSDESDARKDAELKLESEKIAHGQVADQLKKTVGELVDTRQRYEARLAELRDEIARLEEDLNACSTPGARAARVERLLSIAAPGGAGRPPT